MPRFFFDLSTPERYERDESGLTFPSLEEAYLGASEAVLGIGMEMLRERKDPNACRFEVRDGAGEIVLELPFSEVLQPRQLSRPRSHVFDHDRLQLSLERSRRLRAELAEVLVQVRRNALRGMELAEVRWVGPGLVG